MQIYFAIGCEQRRRRRRVIHLWREKNAVANAISATYPSIFFCFVLFAITERTPNRDKRLHSNYENEMQIDVLVSSKTLEGD